MTRVGSRVPQSSNVAEMAEVPRHGRPKSLLIAVRAAFAAAGLALAPGCSAPASLAGDGGVCLSVTDCAEGLVCVYPKGSSSGTCSGDVGLIQYSEEAGTDATAAMAIDAADAQGDGQGDGTVSLMAGDAAANDDSAPGEDGSRSLDAAKDAATPDSSSVSPPGDAAADDVYSPPPPEASTPDSAAIPEDAATAAVDASSD
jgi:hypothetical protein